MTKYLQRCLQKKRTSVIQNVKVPLKMLAGLLQLIPHVLSHTKRQMAE